MQMIVQMTSYFTFIVELCYEIYIMHIDRNSIMMLGHLGDSIFAYIWGIIYSIIILILNHVCQTVNCKV